MYIHHDTKTLFVRIECDSIDYAFLENICGMELKNRRRVSIDHSKPEARYSLLSWIASGHKQLYGEHYHDSNAFSEAFSEHIIEIRIYRRPKSGQIRLHLEAYTHDSIILEPNGRHGLIFKYLRLVFGEEGMIACPESFKIKLDTLERIQTFKAFILREKLVDFELIFEYDVDEIEGLIEELECRYEADDDLLASYAVLECDPDDSLEVIKACYLKRAKEWHPDRFGSADPDTIQTYTILFQNLQNAYDTVRQAKTAV